jgi:putative CocE/NonD family hydrolase
MPDGVHLAATLYLPDGANPAAPAPCLLEALPYRKDDVTASYTPEYVRFAAEFGYAVARVDVRGTGSSGGIALDEYHPQELADLHEVIAWLAAQPWCTGAVGMFGTSWSGFNSLQMACRRPPALKAVVAAFASDDRWSDDVHYMGGALRLLDLVDYPLYMVALNGLPPVPALTDGEPGAWRREWARRVTSSPPWLITWLEQQADGPYWRHGSVRASPGPDGGRGTPSFERIGCPTMLIAGWADGYRNISFRAVRALSAQGTPVRLLLGPWAHGSPSSTAPGPFVDHVPLMARWWDRWLRDVPNGVDAEPPITVFVRGYAPPQPDAAAWPGRWQARDLASLDSGRDVELPFTDGRLYGAAVRGSVAAYQPVLDVGTTAWNSCAGSQPWGQPADQTPDDARSLCLEFDVEPGTVVLGHPRLRLRVRPDDPVTFVSAKLSMVPASGRPSLLLSRGLLNLAYAGGDTTAPRPCPPGEWLDVELELEATGFELPPPAAGDGDGAGPYRLRLALACADWPNTVAPPGTWSQVDLAASALLLPVPAPALGDVADLPPSGGPTAPGAEGDATTADGDGKPGTLPVVWRHGQEVLARLTWAEVDHGSRSEAGFGSRCAEHYTGRVEVEAATGRQRATARSRYEIEWPQASVASEARLDLQADGETFDVRVELDVLDGGTLLAARRWRRRIPRNLA